MLLVEPFSPKGNNKPVFGGGFNGSNTFRGAATFRAIPNKLLNTSVKPGQDQFYPLSDSKQQIKMNSKNPWVKNSQMFAKLS